ncbi:hypothetical protein [Bacillus sp. FJAT-22090]|uniref:hypothetical protein n=1 Tax=Bacillus sp. FJAT-22090 TaxID=1581038 RepID=UPI0011A9F9C6|nr:hypothetical protein [Bacillus sp. FJAT-22090]
MSLVRATGNGISNQIATFEERKRTLQRKDAGDAYRRQADYFQPKIPSLEELEDLLLGNKEKEPEAPEVSAAIREFQQLENSNKQSTNMLDIKGPGIPVQTIGGHTLEKTVELLEKVRSNALAAEKPTPQDLRVAANASAKIQQVNGQIVLHEEANRQIAMEVKQQLEDEAAVSNHAFSDTPSTKTIQEDLESLQKKRLKEKAIAKYSYQVHLKRYGFSDLEPSFFRIA